MLSSPHLEHADRCVAANIHSFRAGSMAAWYKDAGYNKNAPDEHDPQYDYPDQPVLQDRELFPET